MSNTTSRLTLAAEGGAGTPIDGGGDCFWLS